MRCDYGHCKCHQCQHAMIAKRQIRYLFGGDAGAAREIEQQVFPNQERIRELQALLGECTCDAEVRAIVHEQLRNAEQEQLRLQQVAANELQAAGLLGWLWN
jgi:hypothetical protein